MNNKGGVGCSNCVLCINILNRLKNYKPKKIGMSLYDGIINDKYLHSFLGEIIHIQKEERHIYRDLLIKNGLLVKVGRGEGGMRYKINC